MIDLSTWNLTIPEEVPAYTVSTAALNQDYESTYFQQVGSTLFFWAPVTGTATGGSVYPRSELRETLASGELHNWHYGTGSHRLNVSMAVTQVPSSGKTIIGQIHSKDNSKPFAKIVYRHYNGVGYVGLEIRKKPDDAASPVVLAYKGVPLHYPFDYSFDISNGNQLTVNLHGLTYTTTIDPSWDGKRFYFKTGMYVIDNEGPETEGGRVEMYSLDLQHLP
jgi:hypothetical protein